MRWAALVLFAGCSFGTSFDVSRDAAADAAIDVPDVRIAPFCDVQDPSLVACYEMEGNVNDASANNLDATATNLSFVPGRSGMAVQFGLNSAAEIADSPAIDVAAITVEAWIDPFQLPGTGARAGIADMNGQWGMFLHEPTGRLQCTMGLVQQIDAMIPANTWTHVACSYEGGVLKMYVNGVKKYEASGGGALGTGGTSGISLGADNPAGSGSVFNGLLDQVRIMSRARTEAEICDDANCE
jgi:hypothetical protein